MPFLCNFLKMDFKMESLIGGFPNIGKFPILRSPYKSGKNSPALRTNSEIFQGEPLRGDFVENVLDTARTAASLKNCTLSNSSSYKVGPIPAPPSPKLPKIRFFFSFLLHKETLQKGFLKNVYYL